MHEAPQLSLCIGCCGVTLSSCIPPPSRPCTLPVQAAAAGDRRECQLRLRVRDASQRLLLGWQLPAAEVSVSYCIPLLSQATAVIGIAVREVGSGGDRGRERESARKKQEEEKKVSNSDVRWKQIFDCVQPCGLIQGNIWAGDELWFKWSGSSPILALDDLQSGYCTSSASCCVVKICCLCK